MGFCSRWWGAALAALLLAACGPDVVVDDIGMECSAGSCAVAFYVEARRPLVEEIEIEVSVLSQRRGTSAMFTAGSSLVQVRPRKGERVRVETVVKKGVQTGNKAVVRRVR